MDNLYRLDGRVPLGKAIPFGREPTTISMVDIPVIQIGYYPCLLLKLLE